MRKMFPFDDVIMLKGILHLKYQVKYVDLVMNVFTDLCFNSAELNVSLRNQEYKSSIYGISGGSNEIK